MAVEEHAGATGRSLGTILAENPTFPVRFLLKSFSGVLVGGEELERFMEKGLLSNRMCYALGLFVVCGYLMAVSYTHLDVYKRQCLMLEEHFYEV